MGCDIHAFLEVKDEEMGWVTVHQIRGTFEDRNYTLFAALAGVRGEGPDPLGLPPDVADTTKFHSDEWDCDGHSHSYVPLKEAMALYKFTRYDEEEKDDPYAQSYWRVFNRDIEDTKDDVNRYRVVFWFDN